VAGVAVVVAAAVAAMAAVMEARGCLPMLVGPGVAVAVAMESHAAMVDKADVSIARLWLMKLHFRWD